MKNVSVLVVMENEFDFLVINKGFRELQLNYKVEHLKNGKELLEHLSAGTENNFIGLIILGAEMQDISCKDMLRHLQSAPSYKHIPVVVHATSTNDRSLYYNLGASEFVTRHYEYKELLGFVRKIDELINNSANVSSYN
ncbi:MAG: hypothetical protein ACJ77K_19680 [Bacteroidia bacterium]